MEIMNSTDNEASSLQQSATTPALLPSKESSEVLHNDMVRLINTTPNGYSNSISNHKIKPDDQSQQKKHHDSHKSVEHKHSDSSKHNSEHIKHKEGNSSSARHSSSSHSKSSVSKISSHKSSDPSKHKEHSGGHHEKEKKHHSLDHSEHSKHVKNGEKVHKENKENREKLSSSSSSRPSSDFRKEKSKDEKHKERTKDGHSSERKEHDRHKDHKDKKPDGIKDKVSDKIKDRSDKPKDKSEKHKESSDKLKDKSEKHRDKHLDKPKDKISSDKLKEKSIEKPKEKMGDSLKSKSSDKPKGDGEKGSKPKDVLKIKKEGSSDKKDKDIPLPVKREGIVVKKERGASPIKKPMEVKGNDSKKEYSGDRASPIKVKREVLSPIKSPVEDSGGESDEPLQAKAKPSKRVKQEAESDDDWGAKPSKSKKAKADSAKKRKKEVDSDFEEETKKPAKKKVKKVEPREVETASPKKRGKKEDDVDVWKWWEEDKKEDGVKWNTLAHCGPVFAPPYERVPKNVKFYYDGKPMALSELTEEVAGFYGRMLDHDYTGKDIFNTNFFKDWKKVMTPEEKEVIKDLKKCNFNDFNEYYKIKSEERKNMTKEEKAEIKRQNEELQQKYGYCVVDGHRQKIGNFKIEPPGLFRGRGEHPKMGMLKRRVMPEDITINVSKDAKVPDPPSGHRWKKVIHDNKVTWLASWNENILNSTKYIMLNPSSKLKGEKDWQKYETARKLKNHADQIRNTYSEDFKSKEMRVRQRAVALYFIDKLALRAGNEKDEDTADTVGCCSLRVEHITLHEEKDGKPYVIDFDFLGKDSIRYENSVPVEKRAFKNVKLFMENKQPADDLFDRLNTSILNKYLNELMEGLTAKVFRTYNASKTLQEQLDELTKAEMSIPEKLLAYNRANRAVAVLCNHQRSIPKTFSKSMENLKNKMDEKMKQIKDFKKELKQAKADAKNGSGKDKMLYDKKKKRLQQLEEQYKKLEVQATDKEENKQIALGTSKLNYLDPRISVAWCKKWGVPIEKIYNRTQRDKFRWAIEMAGPDFRF